MKRKVFKGKRMNVLVIGGSGFLGSHIADELTSNGYNVTIYDMTPSQWLQPSQKMVIGNLLDQDMLDHCMKNVQYVYHLAGIADIGEATGKPVETVKTNVLGTTIVLEAALKAKIERLIFASTVYVYSHRGAFYRASKQAAENYIEIFQEKFGLNYTILRYGSLYGPRAQKWNGLRKYVEQAVKNNKIIFNGTGEERREFIHVSDAAQLSISILDKKYINKCYTLTGTQVLTGLELSKMIREIIGKPFSIEFSKISGSHDHYVMTPYRFTPKRAMKMVPDTFIDLGHGILEVVEEISEELYENSSTDTR